LGLLLETGPEGLQHQHAQPHVRGRVDLAEEALLLGHHHARRAEAVAGGVVHVVAEHRLHVRVTRYEHEAGQRPRDWRLAPHLGPALPHVLGLAGVEGVERPAAIDGGRQGLFPSLAPLAARPEEPGSPPLAASRNSPNAGGCASSPPSPLSVWPVMNAASSEARKTTAAATSSGLPSRGVRWLRSSIAIISAGTLAASAGGAIP